MNVKVLQSRWEGHQTCEGRVQEGRGGRRCWFYSTYYDVAIVAIKETAPILGQRHISS